MKAIQLEEPKKFRLIEIDEPPPPGPSEVLVRSHRMGICGTDISGYLGKMPFFQYPRIPGHELGVEVLEIGADVDNVAVGDHCSVEPYLNCGHCYACRQNAGNCCLNLEVIGVMIDGGLRPRFLLPAIKLHSSETLSFDQLALVETLAIGCHAVQRGAPVAGEHCLVIGAGPIGLATLEFVKLSGAQPLVMDINQQRLDFCRSTMGVDKTILLSDQLLNRGAEQDLREACSGNLPDIVIDATGHSESMSNSFGYVAPRGRVVFVGLTVDTVSFQHPTFHKPEGTLLCSRNALPGDFTRIIKLIELGQIDTQPWITHHLGFDDVVREFERYTRPATGVIKAIIEI
ncbi:MAG: zinc-binding alcohol dehydrogenase family protein [Planctomycetales bacterium]